MKFKIFSNNGLSKLNKNITSSLFDFVIFPMVGRVYARTISNDLVNVEPLPEPNSNVYFTFYIPKENIGFSIIKSSIITGRKIRV